MMAEQHIELHRQHREAQAELNSWLDDVYMWRAENKQALAWISQIEAAIHENDLRLQTHYATIDRQERHIRLHEHEIATQEQRGTFDAATELVGEHEQFNAKQNLARESHEKVGQSHRAQIAEVKRLYNLIVKGG